MDFYQVFSINFLSLLSVRLLKRCAQGYKGREVNIVVFSGFRSFFKLFFFMFCCDVGSLDEIIARRISEVVDGLLLFSCERAGPRITLSYVSYICTTLFGNLSSLSTVTIPSQKHTR